MFLFDDFFLTSLCDTIFIKENGKSYNDKCA